MIHIHTDVVCGWRRWLLGARRGVFGRSSWRLFPGNQKDSEEKLWKTRRVHDLINWNGSIGGYRMRLEERRRRMRRLITTKLKSTHTMPKIAAKINRLVGGLSFAAAFFLLQLLLFIIRFNNYYRTRKIARPTNTLAIVRRHNAKVGEIVLICNYGATVG